jgi:hypothetical protein
MVRAFGPNVDRIVRRATIVYSADDIRRNITLRLQDGQPCVLELGDDIIVTAGFTIPGGLRAFSIDGAQRFKFLVLGAVPFLFYAQGASDDTGFPVEVRDVTIQLKAQATLTTCFVVEQVSYVSTATFSDAFSVSGVDINASAGTCTNVFAHGSYATALGFRIGRIYVDRLATNGVSNFLAVGDSNAFWQDCTARNVLMASTGAMTFGQGVASSVFSGIIENLSGNVDVSLGSRSVVSIQYALIASFTGNSVSPTFGKVTLMRVATSGARTLSAYDVDLDNLGGGGGAPTNATYVTLSTDATLTQERVLTAGSGISIVDGGAGSTVTISASGGGASLTAATITVPFGLQEQTVSVVDAGATALSKVIVAWGNVADTDENQPSASNVTFSAVGAAGSVSITVSSNDSDNVGGVYKILYILG